MGLARSWESYPERMGSPSNGVQNVKAALLVTLSSVLAQVCSEKAYKRRLAREGKTCYSIPERIVQ